MASSEIQPFAISGEHSYHRRAFAHNYYAPFIYHIILKKKRGCPSFGFVEGDAKIAPGNSGCARINETELGQIIAKAILHLSYQFPAVKILQFCVMPDHVHILLQVLYRTDRHLDFYIDSLKTIIAEKFSKRIEKETLETEIFDAGYCDKPLYDNRSLEGLYKYIRENPHRLAMRMQYPQFFQRVRNLKIDEREYEAYGNLFLFRNPDKMAVKISRKFTPEEKQAKIAAWLAAAEKGTILVSPFISPEEKAVRREAQERGGKVILIVPEAFTERYKPSAGDFELCEAGRLLLISCGLPGGDKLSRQTCVQMNSLASGITEGA